PKLPSKYSEKTDFQKRLESNPYALALSTPVRYCPLSHARLPTFFLNDFTLAPAPGSKDPWLLPSTLYRYSLPPSEREQVVSEPPRLWLQSRHEVVEQATRAQRYKALVGRRIRDKLSYWRGKDTVGRDQDVKWRGDMPEFVRERMRVAAAAAVRRVFSSQEDDTDAAVVHVPGGATEIDGVEDVACVVYLQALETQAVRFARARSRRVVEEVDGIVEKMDKNRPRDARQMNIVTQLFELRTPQPAEWIGNPPLEFPTIDWRGRRVPVYSLSDLLGKEMVGQCVEGTLFEDCRKRDRNGCLIMKESKDTESRVAREWLMRLQGHYAIGQW
ncbi:hypothetical protein LTS18_007396, partial [Coniosporium uncinatum]